MVGIHLKGNPHENSAPSSERHLRSQEFHISRVTTVLGPRQFPCHECDCGVVEDVIHGLPLQQECPNRILAQKMANSREKWRKCISVTGRLRSQAQVRPVDKLDEACTNADDRMMLVQHRSGDRVMS